MINYSARASSFFLAAIKLKYLRSELKANTRARYFCKSLDVATTYDTKGEQEEAPLCLMFYSEYKCLEYNYFASKNAKEAL